MREWSGDTYLMGCALLPTSPAPAPLTISINLNAPTSPAEVLILGNARVTEWELFAENGIIVTESAHLTYSTKQVVVAPPAPPVGVTTPTGGVTPLPPVVVGPSAGGGVTAI